MKRTFLVSCLAFTMVAAGCKGDEKRAREYTPPPPNPTCDLLREVATRCEMPFIVDDDCVEADFDDEERCTVHCAIDGDCTDLTEIICLEDEAANPLYDCILACAPPPFTCADGSTIEGSYECDGFPDCPDGSDEHEGCPAFICDDGTPVPVDAECNSWSDCPDGSDEHDACPIFTCDDGMTLPVGFECDGYPDCADGSDEHEDCPPDPRETLCAPYATP